jgi:hypothetical protein
MAAAFVVENVLPNYSPVLLAECLFPENLVGMDETIENEPDTVRISRSRKLTPLA